MTFFYCRVRLQLSKEISCSAVSTLLKSSPSSIASGRPPQTGRNLKLTSRMSKSSRTEKGDISSAPLMFCDVAHVFCVAGSWCSLSRTKYAWSSSRAARRTATAYPASARTTACWRCRYPHRHSEVSTAVVERSVWRRLNIKPSPSPKTLDSKAVTPVSPLSPKMCSYLAFCSYQSF